MRTPSRARPGAGTMELQMGPLIDCVFLLLTYFLFTITLTTIEGLLPSELALGDQSPREQENTEPEEQLVIRMVSTGTSVRYFLDDWPVTDRSAVLTRLDALGKEATVVLDAGPSVAYDHVIGLYNQSLRRKLSKILFPLPTGAAKPDGEVW